MAKVIKATSHEQKEYDGLYPLYGWVTVNGQRCAVEFPNEGHDNPKYEVMAPKGYIFDEGVHSLLCFSMADLQTRIAQPLVTCAEFGCDHEEEAA